MDKKLQDLAWRVLPAEFRKEVKKLYADALDASNSPHEPDDRKWGNYRVTLLEKLFGKHNLTSDAEGEEMLTVSRKKVQELYSDYCAERDKEEPGSNRSSLGGRIAMLQEFFGSRSLPDETVSDCYQLTEPNPAEPKFKVGDYVRYKGGVHKVVATAKDNRCYLNKILGCIDESDLEPYTEPKENIAETRNFSQDCDKQVDTILKDSFAKERRLNIAAMIMAAMMQNAKWGDKYSHIATISCAAADALIIEVEKNK